jgi:exodeoxyribonuclease-5
LPTWQREAARIAEAARTIRWHQPSLHEGAIPLEVEEVSIYASPEAVADQPPVVEKPDIQGGQTRGLLLHKLIEEVLSGETAESEAALTLRAAELLGQMGMPDAYQPADGPSSPELAASVLRGLKVPEVEALRPRLLPEVPVYSGLAEGNAMTLTAGIADAVAVDAAGKITDVIDWKSDVAPAATMIALYRQQVKDYLGATGAVSGLIVFLTTGQAVKVVAP